jgi:transcriptional regulator with XRE-family HTH domain
VAANWGGGHRESLAAALDGLTATRVVSFLRRKERGMSDEVGTVRIRGARYAVVARGEEPLDEPSVPRRLWRARREAGLTQVQLARRICKSQTLVSRAETGQLRVTERYLSLVLKACDLPKNWGAPAHKRRVKPLSQLKPSELAGMDPETLRVVRLGSKRDKELAQKYVWWANGRPVGRSG